MKLLIILLCWLTLASLNDPWSPPKTSTGSTDLAWLIGSWKIEKHYYRNPFMPGKNLVETEQCAWAVGGYYVICNSTDVLDGKKPVRETVIWSRDAEPHVLRFVDISPDDSTDQPTAGWCRIDGDMWYCYSEPRLENSKTIHLRFVTKNTPSSANGNSQFSEDGTKWLPLSDDSWTKVSQDTQATSSQTPPGQKEIENQIIALEKRMWNADANEVSKLEGEDYEAIKHAHRYHRTDDEAAAKDVKFALTSMDDIRVRMLRPDVALITYHATQKGSFRGTEVPPSLYFGSIWVNRSGDWKNVFLEENAPDVFTDIYKSSDDRAQPQAQRSEIAQARSLDGDLSTQALAKEREILDAQNRNDWTAFAELLADDLVAIDEDGIHSKKELLEQIRAAEVRFSDYKMESVKVIPQTNGAIVAYKETLVGTEHGKPFTWHIYTHSHWESRGGKWLMTMFQDSTAKE